LGELRPDLKLYLYTFAPTITGFVQWVLERAHESGIGRLYFLARDGYPFYLAARVLAAGLPYPVECRYLYVSRYCLRLPEYHLLGENCVERICIGGIHVTFAKLMGRAGLSRDEGLRVAEEAGLAREYEKALSYRQIMGLKESLKRNALFLKLVEEHSVQAYKRILPYLEQEGLLKSDKDITWAVVDSGWTGTVQESLRHLLDSAGGMRGRSLKGFYFGLYELPEGADASCYESYYFSPERGLREKVYFSNCLFETVCSAPEGMTLGYRRDASGRTEPVTAVQGNPNAVFLRKAGQILQEYVRQYMRISSSAGAENTHSVVSRLLYYMMGKPSVFEAATFGRLLFSDDMREEDLQEVAVELTGRQIREHHLVSKVLMLTGIRRGVLQESGWIEGSIVRYGRGAAYHLWQVAGYKYLSYFCSGLGA